MAYRYFLTYSLLIFFLASCTRALNVKGVYASRFFPQGFLSESITFNSDSNFTYRNGGDNNSYIASGSYQRDGNKIKLIYKSSELDTLSIGEYKFKFGSEKKSDGNWIPKVDTVSWPSISYRKVGGRPTEFIFKNGHLFFINQGEITKPIIWGYSMKKKYLLFGTRYYKRKYYLKYYNIQLKR